MTYNTGFKWFNDVTQQLAINSIATGKEVEFRVNYDDFYVLSDLGDGINVAFNYSGVSVFDAYQVLTQLTNSTEQLRIKYDSSNYYSTTVGSTGTVTLNAVGSGAKFVFSDAVEVPDEVYGSGWNGSTQVPTKNAVYDKIESLSGGGGSIDGSGAANKLAIWSDSDTLTSDTNLHWDTTNDRLGIKTATPNTSLQVAGGAHITKELACGLFNNQGDAYEGRIMMSGSGSEFSIYDRNLTVISGTAGDRFTLYNTGKLFRIYTDVNNDIFTMSNTGSIGLGLGGFGGTASARIHAVSTTEQLRLGYDASNYLKTTVSSAGLVTFDAVGSSKSFVFAQPTFTAIPTITTAADGTLTINVANTEFAERTGLTATTTIETTGTAINGQKLIIRLKDNGTSRSLTWNAIFVQGGPPLPTATTAGKWMHLGFIYNSTNSKWMLVASSVEA